MEKFNTGNPAKKPTAQSSRSRAALLGAALAASIGGAAAAQENSGYDASLDAAANGTTIELPSVALEEVAKIERQLRGQNASLKMYAEEMQLQLDQAKGDIDSIEARYVADAQQLLTAYYDDYHIRAAAYGVSEDPTIQALEAEATENYTKLNDLVREVYSLLSNVESVADGSMINPESVLDPETTISGVVYELPSAEAEAAFQDSIVGGPFSLDEQADLIDAIKAISDSLLDQDGIVGSYASGDMPDRMKDKLSAAQAEQKEAWTIISNAFSKAGIAIPDEYVVFGDPVPY